MMTSSRPDAFRIPTHAFKLVSPGEKGRKTCTSTSVTRKKGREKSSPSLSLSLFSGLNKMDGGGRRVCSRGRCLRRFTCSAAVDDMDGDQGYNVIRSSLSRAWYCWISCREWICGWCVDWGWLVPVIDMDLIRCFVFFCFRIFRSEKVCCK